MGEFSAPCWRCFRVIFLAVLGKAFGAGMGAAFWLTHALTLGASFGFGDINEVSDLFSKDTGFDFFDVALVQIAELERTI